MHGAIELKLLDFIDTYIEDIVAYIFFLPCQLRSGQVTSTGHVT